LEDAESLVEDRNGGNRSRLEDSFNVSDGLMSEFLQVQVIATINCPMQKLDPTITRPGRLLAWPAGRPGEGLGQGPSARCRKRVQFTEAGGLRHCLGLCRQPSGCEGIQPAKAEFRVLKKFDCD
jgi:hypothetical protein